MPRTPRPATKRPDVPGLAERYQFRLPGTGILEFFLYCGEAETLGITTEVQPISARITHLDQTGFRLRPDNSAFETAPEPPPWWPQAWTQIVTLEQLTRYSRTTWPVPSDYYVGLAAHQSFVPAAILPAIANWFRSGLQSGEMALDDAPAVLKSLPGWESEIEAYRTAGRFLTRTKRGRRSTHSAQVTLASLALADCLRLRNPSLSIRQALRLAAKQTGWTTGRQRKSNDIEDAVDSLVRAWNRSRAK